MLLVGTMEYFRAKVYLTNGTATEHLLLPHQFRKFQPNPNPWVCLLMGG